MSFSRNYASPPRKATTALPPDRDIMEKLNSSPKSLIDKPIEEPSATGLHPSNIVYIGSYNWTDEGTPTIIVPGSPPQWRNRPVPFNVAADSKISYVNQNNFRMPHAGLVPLVSAVQTVTPDFDWSSVDIVTDRNNLRKLLRWITYGTKLGKIVEVGLRDFRIDLEVAGGRTLLMARWDFRDREMPSTKYRTYGFNFEDESTSPPTGCNDATAHHRIICYDLDDLRIVVRFEVDACFDAPDNLKKAAKAKAASTAPSVDDLEAVLGGLSLSSSSTTGSTATSELVVRAGGTLVAQANIIEMTTRKARESTRRLQREFDWREAYPQLYLSQTAHHFLAMHDNGRFFEVKKHKLNTGELKRVDKELQPSFRALKTFLGEIRQTMIDQGAEARFSLLCRDSEMALHTREERACMPDTLLKLFSEGTERQTATPEPKEI